MGFVANGRDPTGREKARKQAQANANFFQRRYVVFQDTNANWYQERWVEGVDKGELVVDPEPGSVRGQSDVPGK